MLLLVLAVVLGLIAGLARPSLGARSARVRIGYLPLLVLGAGASAVSRIVPDHLATVAMGVSLAVLLGFVLGNAHVTGVLVIGLGLMLNLVGLVVNNGIPVRPDALVRAGVVERSELPTTRVSAPRHLETPTDRAAVLGDVVPIPFASTVLSFGDLIVVLGAADAVRELARRRQRTWSTVDRVDYDSTMMQLRAVHDWGTAPSAAPVSGSQYSEKLDLRTPVTIDLTSPSRTEDDALEAASHSR